MIYVLFLELIIGTILIIIFILSMKFYFASKINKRIGYYSLDPIKDDNISFSDKIVGKYNDFVVYMRKYISKSVFLKRSAKKYDKYIKYNDRNRIKNIDFISNKIIISFGFVLLIIFSQVFTSNIYGFFDYVLFIFSGYFILDIYLYFAYKKRIKLIDGDLLRAVIIMNNAFKTGKSTLQALKIAADELPYPISDEFRKMYLDMKFGLSVDSVFERFAKRVNVEEAVYLSSSLAILNKTGGNIVEVFSSIERTLFDKKKLNEELKNISASPNMIVKILLFVPIVFMLLIYILDPTYFSPLFESVFGYIIISIIVIMFIIYNVLLRRILKIEV